MPQIQGHYYDLGFYKAAWYSLWKLVHGNSSIIKWGYQDNFKPVFFYEKISRTQKHSKQKSTNKTKLSKH